MTWTYSNTSLSTDLAKVRLYIGDTNTAWQLLTDEEIAVATTLETNLFLAASMCCEFILAKLARDNDDSKLGISVSRSQLTEHYRGLRDSLALRASRGVEVYWGGGSIDERDTIAEDEDFPQAGFTRGMDDNNT
jgi:hypothetical protein